MWRQDLAILSPEGSWGLEGVCREVGGGRLNILKFFGVGNSHQNPCGLFLAIPSFGAAQTVFLVNRVFVTSFPLPKRGRLDSGRA